MAQRDKYDSDDARRTLISDKSRRSLQDSAAAFTILDCVDRAMSGSAFSLDVLQSCMNEVRELGRYNTNPVDTFVHNLRGASYGSMYNVRISLRAMEQGWLAIDTPRRP